MVRPVVKAKSSKRVEQLVHLRDWIKDRILAWAESVVAYFAKNDHQGKKFGASIQGGTRATTWGGEGDEIVFEVDKRVGRGFWGVVYRVKIDKYPKDLVDDFPILFKADGSPREDLVIKFNNNIPWLSKMFEKATREEVEQTKLFVDALRGDPIEGTEILFAKTGDNPFLIKPFNPAWGLSRMAKEQDQITEEQVVALKRDIFDKAIRLYVEGGLGLDIKVENLVWDPVKKKFMMYEATMTPNNNNYFIRDGFEGYLNMLRLALARYREAIQ